MIYKYARLLKLCKHLIKWLDAEHFGLVDEYVKPYIEETYPDLYNEIFGTRMIKCFIMQT